MESVSKRQWIGLSLLMGILLIGVGWLAWRSLAPTRLPALPAHAPSSALTMPSTQGTEPTTAPTVQNRIAVHVAGAVKHPGVYYLPIGSRNIDALKAAGGPTPQANTDAVNLAAYAQDASQLYIPTKAEHGEGGGALNGNVSATIAGKAITTEGGQRSHTHHSGHNNKLTSPTEGQININTANAEQLERVPGIGPSIAARILAFRQQNGPFQKLEDLMQVSGIGPKKFAKMKPFLCLH